MQQDVRIAEQQWWGNKTSIYDGESMRTVGWLKCTATNCVIASYVASANCNAKTRN